MAKSNLATIDKGRVPPIGATAIQNRHTPRIAAIGERGKEYLDTATGEVIPHGDHRRKVLDKLDKAFPGSVKHLADGGFLPGSDGAIRFDDKTDNGMSNVQAALGSADMSASPAVPAIGSAGTGNQPAGGPRPVPPIGGDTGSGFAMVDGKRVGYGDIGTTNDTLSGGGSLSVIPLIGDASGKRPVQPIGDIGGSRSGDLQSALNTADRPVQPIGGDSGSGFAMVGGKRIGYQDIGTGKDPLAGEGGVSTVPAIGSTNPVNTQSFMSRKPVQPIGGDIGSGFAMVDGKRVNYADIGTPRDTLSGGGGSASVIQPLGGETNQGRVIPTATNPSSVPTIGQATPITEQSRDAFGKGRVDKDGNPVMFNPVHEIPNFTAGTDYVKKNNAPAEAVRAKLGFLPDDYFKNPAKYQGLLAQSAVDPKMTEAVNQGEYQKGVLAIDAPYKRGLIANEQNKIAVDTPLVSAKTRNLDSDTRYRNFMMTPEGAAANAKKGELPAEGRMVGFLVDSGIAKDHKAAWDMLKTAKSDPVHTVASLVQSMEAQQEKQGIDSTNPRYKSRDEMVNDAMSLIGHVQGRIQGNEQKGPSTGNARDVSPLRDYIGRNNHRPTNELIASAQRLGWTDDEIRSAQRPAEAASGRAASPQQQTAMKATRSGNSISFQGESYPLNADGTVVIGNRKYQVQ